MNTVDHSLFMSLALELARKGQCTVSPNPMVGCLLVKNNEIIGQGYHKRSGENHAEIEALTSVSCAQDATAYVTLEPCCHHGKTGPCTQALIRAGIKKVFIACLDPNPLMNGKGVQELVAANIEVEIGLCEAEAKQLNEIFFHYILKQRPFVIAKWAMSLDGRTIVNNGDSPQISDPESQKHVHHQRQQVDAILIGSQTAIKDNPYLNVRLSSTQVAKQPIKIVLSTHNQLPENLNLFTMGKTIIATTKKPAQEIVSKNIEIIVLPKNADNQVCLQSLLKNLGQRGITSILVEGGMTVHESFMKENLIDKIQVYIAPVIIGPYPHKKRIEHITSAHIASDIYVTGSIKGESYV